jgi:pSer/pThr/pTyr-binding forkhead associated (FHA) protein
VFCDDTVSRHHARLELRDGRWFLIDLDSSNGTSVNGRRVRDAEVRPGDRIRLGAAGFTL